MTRADLFRDDAYRRSCPARVRTADANGVVLDSTVFYAAGGGQPGDTGVLRTASGAAITIADTVYGAERAIVHVPEPGAALPDPDETVTAEIDWTRRYRLMRMHTCLHLLSVALPYPVTGGQIGPQEGRLDFDMADPADKDEVSRALNALIALDEPVSARWIEESELDANPGLVKTMAVKPPRGEGRVRLIAIGERDLQPCGGTHVARTGEIGAVRVAKIEKKGARNRRVRVVFAE